MTMWHIYLNHRKEYFYQFMLCLITRLSLSYRVSMSFYHKNVEATNCGIR